MVVDSPTLKCVLAKITLTLGPEISIGSETVKSTLLLIIIFLLAFGLCDNTSTASIFILRLLIFPNTRLAALIAAFACGKFIPFKLGTFVVLALVRGIATTRRTG